MTERRDFATFARAVDALEPYLKDPAAFDLSPAIRRR